MVNILHEDYKCQGVCSNPPKEIAYIIKEDTGCWICVSHFLDSQGYPRLQRYNKIRTVINYIYSTFINEISKDQIVYTTCKDTRCINPEHLYLGEKCRKERVILTEAQKQEIRSSELPNFRLAGLYKVNKKEILRIRCFQDK